jgi:xylulokinase
MKNNQYFLGIDIGTYSSKGVLTNGEGEVICRASVPHGMENPRLNYYEHDADAVWWHDFCAISKSLIKSANISPTEIRAVGGSTLGSDCLPVDREGNPLRKAILYGIDARSDKEIRELTEYYGKEKVKELFGRPIVSGDVAAKILWIKHNEPEIYQKTYKFLTGSSFLTEKLTGEYVIDRFLGIASFRPFYREDGSIREEMCEPICRPDQLAEGRVVTDIIGVVTAAAAAETGLAEGTPVITGTGDSTAEAISIGVLAPDDMMVQFGSSLFYYCCTDHMVKDDRVRGNTFTIPGTYSVAGGTNNAGTLQKWYRDLYFPDLLEEERQGGRNAYAAMMDGMDSISPGSEGLITIPYFAGERTPVNDPDARGMVIGLTNKHTRTHLYRSCLESIAFSVAQHVQIFRDNGLNPQKIMAAGGGTKNLLWMQMVADICGLPVHIARETEGASYGDALMAAIGCGYYKDFKSLKKVIKVSQVLTPDWEKHKAYQPYYHLFEELYRENCGNMHQLAALQKINEGNKSSEAQQKSKIVTGTT